MTRREVLEKKKGQGMKTPTPREILEELCHNTMGNPPYRIDQALSALREVVLGQNLKGLLRAVRDEKGNDPFIRYQDAMCSKGYLIDIIEKAVLEDIANLFGGEK